jgi:hypothetical protein
VGICLADALPLRTPTQYLSGVFRAGLTVDDKQVSLVHCNG